MLLKDWKGFTHFDPIEGEVPPLFGGRLTTIIERAREPLEGMSASQVDETARQVAEVFREKWPDFVRQKFGGEAPVHTHLRAYCAALGSRLYSVGPAPSVDPFLHSPEAKAVMALMLGHMAIDLADTHPEQSALLAIDAQEAISKGVSEKAYAHFVELSIQQETRLKHLHKELVRFKKHIAWSADERNKIRVNNRRAANDHRHRPNHELRAYALELARDVRGRKPKSTAHAIAKTIYPRVASHAKDIGYSLSTERGQKTVYEWVRNAEKEGNL